MRKAFHHNITALLQQKGSQISLTLSCKKQTIHILLLSVWQHWQHKPTGIISNTFDRNNKNNIKHTAILCDFVGRRVLFHLFTSLPTFSRLSWTPSELPFGIANRLCIDKAAQTAKATNNEPEVRRPMGDGCIATKNDGMNLPLQLYKSKIPRSSEILINTLHRACYLSSFSLRNGRWCFCSFSVWKSIICELISVELHSTARNAKIRRLSPTSIELQKQLINHESRMQGRIAGSI